MRTFIRTLGVVALAVASMGATRADRDATLMSCARVIDMCGRADQAYELACIGNIRGTLETFKFIEGPAPSFCLPKLEDQRPVLGAIRSEIAHTQRAESTPGAECIRAAAQRVFPCS